MELIIKGTPEEIKKLFLATENSQEQLFISNALIHEFKSKNITVGNLFQKLRL